MSINTRIYTQEKIALMDVAKRIVDMDDIDLVIKNNSPYPKLYRKFISNREVEVTQEEYGYNVNLNVLAAKEDYELYRMVVKHIMGMTSGIAVYEDETRIKDADDFFNETFIEQCLESDFRIMMVMMKEKQMGSIFCPFRKFYMGERIYNEILRQGNDVIRQRNHLHTKIRNSQYWIISNKDTPLYQLEGKEKDNGRPVTATIYSRNDYDYVLYADRFILIINDQESIDLPYDQFWGIAPFSWHRIDEYQFFAQKLDDDEWERFVKQARRIKKQ